VLDGLTSIKPSIHQLALLFEVSCSTIANARKLSPERRQAVLDGHDNTSFACLLKAPKPLALPKPSADIMRRGRTINAAIAAEAAE
jgi:hypothetical protein